MEQDAEDDDGGGGGEEQQGCVREGETEGGARVSAGYCDSGMDGLRGAGWRRGSVGGSGGCLGAREEVGAGGDVDGEEEGDDSGVEEEDRGLSCWLPAGGREGGLLGEGGVQVGGVAVEALEGESAGDVTRHEH